jgi:hypothetical protein
MTPWLSVSKFVDISISFETLSHREVTRLQVGELGN